EKKKEIEDRQIRMQLRDGELYLTGHTVVSADGTVHKDGWYGVCVSADGKRLLTTGIHDSTLRLWDADTGKQLRVFAGHTNGVVGAALSLAGQRVPSAAGDVHLDSDPPVGPRDRQGGPQTVRRRYQLRHQRLLLTRRRASPVVGLGRQGGHLGREVRQRAADVPGRLPQGGGHRRQRSRLL